MIKGICDTEKGQYSQHHCTVAVTKANRQNLYGTHHSLCLVVVVQLSVNESACCYISSIQLFFIEIMDWLLAFEFLVVEVWVPQVRVAVFQNTKLSTLPPLRFWVSS